MSYLTPTLDHVVINSHRQMDAAAETYRRLGFTLTPRGHHSLGSINHLAIFGTDYLELIGLPEAGGGRLDLLGWPIGLNGLVWGSEDADATHAAITAAGLPVLPAQSFTRPVNLGETSLDAAFRTVRLTDDTTPAGRLYFCQHFTRELVWRDAWRAHANGVVGVAGAILTAAEPTRLAGLFRRMFGDGAVRQIQGGFRLAVGLSWFDVITLRETQARLGPAAPAQDQRNEAMTALVLRVRSLAQAAHALPLDLAIRAGGKLVVPAETAFGATLIFEE